MQRFADSREQLCDKGLENFVYVALMVQFCFVFCFSVSELCMYIMHNTKQVLEMTVSENSVREQNWIPKENVEPLDPYDSLNFIKEFVQIVEQHLYSPFYSRLTSMYLITSFPPRLQEFTPSVGGRHGNVDFRYIWDPGHITIHTL